MPPTKAIPPRTGGNENGFVRAFGGVNEPDDTRDRCGFHPGLFPSDSDRLNGLFRFAIDPLAGVG